MKAVEAAINSPLLDNVGIEGARAIVVNISASMDSLGMDETTQIVEHIQQTAGADSNIIYGIVYDEEMGDEIRVTVIATRYEDAPVRNHTQTRTSINTPIMSNPYASPSPIKKEKAPETLVQSVEEEYPANITAEEKAALERLSQKERIERIQKLNSKEYDVHDPESLQKLENIPAYERKKKVFLDLTDTNGNKNFSSLSRTSIDEDKEKKFKLKERNPFLHDNVD